MKNVKWLLAAILTAILLPAIPAYGAGTLSENGFLYTTSNGAATITGYEGAGGDVTVPDTLGGVPVQSIGNGAFKNCTDLTLIDLPDSLTHIYDDAFYGCAGLNSIKISASSKLTHIGDNAFYDCTNLTAIDLPQGMVSIWGYAFYNCTSLTSVTLPDTVTDLLPYAF